LLIGPTVRILSAGLLLSVCGATACALPDDDAPGNADVTVSDGKADASAQIGISAGTTSTITFTAPAFPIELSVACPISADPDVVGTQFKVASAALGLTASSTAHASLWQWSGEPQPGPATLKITGTSGSQTCTVRLRQVTGTCTASSVSRTPETGHNHLRVGTNITTWGSFPAAGNHWGAWAPWNTVYTKPVKRGFTMHNLEHGGLVLSYGCSSPSESTECRQAAENLEALKGAFGEARVIVTPDPEQPSLYGARGWRVGYQSDCFNDEQMLQFMGDHFRNGREDIDADPPVPYDPTTTNVPCVDIMAAPDSCS
jgi:hypothetical protein